SGAAAGSGASLEAAIRAACPADGTGYLWAAAESSALLPVRRFATRERGLPKSHVNITGYWHAEPDDADAADPAAGRDGVAASTAAAASGAGRSDAAATASTASEASVAVAASGTSAADANPPARTSLSAPGTTRTDTAVRPPASPLAWFVVRAALRIGLVDALADAPGRPLATVAGELGIASDRLALLLPALRGSGVVAGAPDALELAPFGDELIDDEHVREQFDGHHADELLALEALAPALRGEGASAWELRHGATLAEHAADADVAAELVEHAEVLSYLLSGLVTDPGWERVARCALTGPGAAAVLDALVEHGLTAAFEVVADTVLLEALRESTLHPGATSWATEASGRADLAVAAMALDHRTDAEAMALLTRLRRDARRLVVIESSRPDTLSPDAAEHALHAFATTGAPMRDADELGRLAASAGWAVDRVVPLGWGVEAVWLR
ncbi:SIP domain-containing protein, partial [Microbacterium sp. 18062]|uniref:SIP domain-containing protein n=1 Tax=Microbacterium sp. 18062 TaxID=2681410 RepID=UPI00190F10F2